MKSLVLGCYSLDPTGASRGLWAQNFIFVGELNSYKNSSNADYSQEKRLSFVPLTFNYFSSGSLSSIRLVIYA